MRRALLCLAALAVFLVILIPVVSSAQQAPHCKAPDHLAVVASQSTQSDPAWASYLPTMHCTNDPSYTGSGELINVRPNRPDRGLHLFPASVAWMPNRLRAEANAPGPSVVVLHSVGGRLQPFATFTDATALALADQIEAAGP